MLNHLITVDDAPDAERAAIKIQATTTTTRTFDVFEMHCAACASMIDDKLLRCRSLLQARAHYSTQRARKQGRTANSRAIVPDLLGALSRFRYAWLKGLSKSGRQPLALSRYAGRHHDQHF